MTIWEMVRLLARQWLVVVLGVLCTGAVAAGPARGDSVVFSRTELAFLAPTNAVDPNALRTSSDAVIMTAGIVARRIIGPGPIPKFASTEVTLFDQGIRDGWSLRLPDTGGQWAHNYATQELILEVVGPSKNVVERRQTDLITRVQNELATLQRQFGVADVYNISVIEAPERSVIYTVTGDRRRALGMTLLLGGSATAASALAVDRVRAGRRRGRKAAGSSAGTEPGAGSGAGFEETSNVQ